MIKVRKSDLSLGRVATNSHHWRRIFNMDDQPTTNIKETLRELIETLTDDEAQIVLDYIESLIAKRDA